MVRGNLLGGCCGIQTTKSANVSGVRAAYTPNKGMYSGFVLHKNFTFHAIGTRFHTKVCKGMYGPNPLIFNRLSHPSLCSHRYAILAL